MSIILGVVDNNFHIIPPAGGFGGIKACRLSNYTGDALVITNINPDYPGQEYLLPFQQSVYQIENIRQPPSLSAYVLGQDFSTSNVLVEWSTEPLIDFPGTYPANLTQAFLASAGAPAFEVHTLAVPDDGATHEIPAEARRISLSFINNGTVDLRYAAFDSGWTGRPILPVGDARTVDTVQAVYFRVATPMGGDGQVQWLMTRFGSPPVT